jgi:hypothetical protein
VEVAVLKASAAATNRKLTIQIDWERSKKKSKKYNWVTITGRFERPISGAENQRLNH